MPDVTEVAYAAVNEKPGLMDGWLYPLGFFSHDLSKVGCQLAIQGYSDVVPFGSKWWKFDLPRNWRLTSSAVKPTACSRTGSSPSSASSSAMSKAICAAGQAFSSTDSA